eukprot:349023-Prorocentrum_minimum.AAC.1
MIAGGIIHWSSDSSVNYRGFRICSFGARPRLDTQNNNYKKCVSGMNWKIVSTYEPKNIVSYDTYQPTWGVGGGRFMPHVF